MDMSELLQDMNLNEGMLRYRSNEHLSNKDLVHLHVHSQFSTLDGGNKIEDCIARVKELGMESIAITDHNHIAGWHDFLTECRANGIKPILGCEMYQTWDANILKLSAEERRQYAIEKAIEAGVITQEEATDRKATKKSINEKVKDYAYDTKQYHLIVLAMNQTGMNNLIKLQSEASDTCTFNGRFLCDFPMLEKYNEGLIVLSACVGGLIPNLIAKGHYDLAREQAMEFQRIFEDRFYLELQPLTQSIQERANAGLIRLSEELGIPLVATNDVHYTLKEDFEDHDTLVCVGTGKKKLDENRMRYDHEFWLRDAEEMLLAFERHEHYIDEEIYINALRMTKTISDRISTDIKLGSDKPLFPKVTVPKGMTHESYLTAISFNNLYKYLKKKNLNFHRRKYERRLKEELGVINSKGYAPYILKIIENAEFCKENDIPIGPGRGSAAGSLCLFVNECTKVIDPLKYDLLFFRFLTEDRIDPPDFDGDYSYFGREKLIRHLEDIHGHDAVCHIGTITALGVKSGLKDFGRALDYDFGAMNELSKDIDFITDSVPQIKFKDIEQLREEYLTAIDENNEEIANRLAAKYMKLVEVEERYPELFRLARKFEGCPRNMGVHPSGILVMPCNVTDYFPTRTVGGVKVALFDGPQLESMGAIKLDILGLKTLDVLDKTLKSIDENLTLDDLYDMVEDYAEDQEIYKMLLNKECEGIFQMESALFKMLIELIEANNINDLSVICAIGRPGPLSAKMDQAYANRKKGLEEAIPVLPNTEEITADTFHTIIYQEQCMLIAKKVAGFNDSQADSILRKALAKKKADKMEQARRLFIYGKVNREPKEGEDNGTVYFDPTGKLGDPVLGGVNNGYKEEELLAFWDKLKGYASYLFNKSHSAVYAAIALCTAILKRYYPDKFYAALLTMQDTSEKTELYVSSAIKKDINVFVPNINTAVNDFKASEDGILFGLGSVKGVGQASIEEITSKAPYIDLQDAISRVSKKSMNKRVLTALIKAGAFDFYKENRYELLNEMMDIRKDKDERFDTSLYGEDACKEFETSVLGISLTYKDWWKLLPNGAEIQNKFEYVSKREMTDKRGRKMAFVKFKLGSEIIDSVIFSGAYAKVQECFTNPMFNRFNVKGKKDDKGKLIVSSVEPSYVMPYDMSEMA